MHEGLQQKIETPEKKIETDIVSNYPFLAARMERLKQPVHYDESHLTHLANCQQELEMMKSEFYNLDMNEADKQKYFDLVRNALNLHEISKVVDSGEVEGVDDKAMNEERSGQIIKTKYSELGINNEADAKLVSFLVSNYHLLNELFTKKINPEEIGSKISGFSSQLDIKPGNLLELLRILSNANNLSAIEVKNRNEGKKYSREKVKSLIDGVTEQVRDLL